MSTTAEQPAIAACSFCLKPNTDVATLVAGPGVYICDGCVTLCAQVIDGKPAAVARLAAWERATTVEEVLAHLPRVAAAGTQVDRDLAAWVTRARTLGATWGQIGQALDITRQAAWERFSSER